MFIPAIPVPRLQLAPHPSPSADGLVKAPAAGHPLPLGEGCDLLCVGGSIWNLESEILNCGSAALCYREPANFVRLASFLCLILFWAAMRMI
jgi:hypothetical protein